MGVESRDFIDLREGELHFLRQRDEVPSREIAVTVLDQMQVLDEEITAAVAVAKERTYLFERPRIDLTALRRAWRAAPAGLAAVIGRQDRWRLGEAHFFFLKRKNVSRNRAKQALLQR